MECPSLDAVPHLSCPQISHLAWTPAVSLLSHLQIPARGYLSHLQWRLPIWIAVTHLSRPQIPVSKSPHLDPSSVTPQPFAESWSYQYSAPFSSTESHSIGPSSVTLILQSSACKYQRRSLLGSNPVPHLSGPQFFVSESPPAVSYLSRPRNPTTECPRFDPSSVTPQLTAVPSVGVS